MYKVEYNDDGRLLMLKIEELCLFSPKAIDGVIARLKALRERPWHDWSADRHNRKALEMVIQNGGLPGLFAAGALETEQTQQQPAAPAHRPQRQPAIPPPPATRARHGKSASAAGNICRPRRLLQLSSIPAAAERGPPEPKATPPQAGSGPKRHSR